MTVRAHRARRERRAGAALAIAASFCLHGGTMALLGEFPAAAAAAEARPEPMALEAFELSAPEPEEPEEAQPAPEEAEVAPPPRRRRRMRSQATRPSSPQETPDAPSASPLPQVLDGFVLEGGGVPVAIGEAASPGSTRASPMRRGAVGGGGSARASGARNVALGDLSRRPVPPDEPQISACLRARYPARARAQGLEGHARVRLHIHPDGSPGRISVRDESDAEMGFGEACMACLRGRDWTAPLARGGEAVATTVQYRCEFDVER